LHGRGISATEGPVDRGRRPLAESDHPFDAGPESWPDPGPWRSCRTNTAGRRRSRNSAGPSPGHQTMTRRRKSLCWTRRRLPVDTRRTCTPIYPTPVHQGATPFSRWPGGPIGAANRVVRNKAPRPRGSSTGGPSPRDGVQDLFTRRFNKRSRDSVTGEDWDDRQTRSTKGVTTAQKVRPPFLNEDRRAGNSGTGTSVRPRSFGMNSRTVSTGREAAGLRTVSAGGYKPRNGTHGPAAVRGA